jgi:hypothetical protein
VTPAGNANALPGMKMMEDPIWLADRFNAS